LQGKKSDKEVVVDDNSFFALGVPNKLLPGAKELSIVVALGVPGSPVASL
jgi:hypothetical protein